GLAKGDWERGLPLLARSEDANLKSLAARELAAPAAGGEQLPLAEGWLDLAGKEKGLARRNLQRLALYWDHTASLAPTGADRDKAEARLRELEQALPGHAFEVVLARTGAGAKWDDVTEAVRNEAKASRVLPPQFLDNNPGKAKSVPLVVVYRYGEDLVLKVRN